MNINHSLWIKGAARGADVGDGPALILAQGAGGFEFNFGLQGEEALVIGRGSAVH